MTGTRAYRGVPGPERRDRRRQALVDATLDLLLADGLPGVTVRAVCAAAQLTPRYFYEGFADLDALLVATVASVTDEVATASTRAIASAPDVLAEQVRAAIDAGFGVVATDPRKAAALLVAAAGPGPLREQRHALVSEFADLAMQRLPALRNPPRSARPVVRATALFLMGGSVDVIEAVLAGRLRMSRGQLVDHLTAVWLGALQVGLRPGTARADPG